MKRKVQLFILSVMAMFTAYCQDTISFDCPDYGLQANYIPEMQASGEPNIFVTPTSFPGQVFPTRDYSYIYGVAILHGTEWRIPMPNFKVYIGKLDMMQPDGTFIFHSNGQNLCLDSLDTNSLFRKRIFTHTITCRQIEPGLFEYLDTPITHYHNVYEYLFDEPVPITEDSVLIYIRPEGENTAFRCHNLHGFLPGVDMLTDINIDILRIITEQDPKWRYGRHPSGRVIFYGGFFPIVRQINQNDDTNSNGDTLRISTTVSTHTVLSPNPVSSYLTVKASDGSRCCVEVFNVQGHRVASIDNVLSEAIIDVSTYPIGIYTVRISTTTGSEIRKVMVAR